MRLTRKLFVLALMALATMAFGASSASAAEVADEATGIHCDAVFVDDDHGVTGGCRVRALSEVETRVQAFVPALGGFVTISTCEDQFEAAIGEDGTGVLYNAVTSGHEGPLCTRTQCDEADMTKRPWPLALSNDASSMEITFCLRGVNEAEGVLGTECHTDIALIRGEGHALEFFADGVTYGSCENQMGGVRVIGHWDVVPGVGHPAIEIS